MFLRSKTRRKDGEEHRYWSIVENRRVRGNRVVQRQGLYLVEINDRQQAAWSRSIEVFAEGRSRTKQMALLAEGRAAAVSDSAGVEIRLGELQLRRPRQSGNCWLACDLWDRLELDAFWSDRLPVGRKGTRRTRCCNPPIPRATPKL